VLQRSDEIACADLLSSLLYKNDRGTPWKKELMRECRARSGIWGRAVSIAWDFGQGDGGEKLHGLDAEEAVIQLARIWRWANTSGPSTTVDGEMLHQVLLGLPPVLQLLALGQLGQQWSYLPEGSKGVLTAEPRWTKLLPSAETPADEKDEFGGRAMSGFPIRTLVGVAKASPSACGPV